VRGLAPAGRHDPNDSRGIAHRAADAVRESRGGELPALRRWLIDSASQDDAETRVARLAILDALIQRDPWKALKRSFPAWVGAPSSSAPRSCWS
jgi:hypothetical protein